MALMDSRDQLVHAQGPQGSIGEQGMKGDPGEPGLAGSDGTDGQTVHQVEIEQMGSQDNQVHYPML